MSASSFAEVPEGRVADAKGVEALIREYLSAVKRCDLEALRSTFDPSANISHYYVKGDAVRVNGVDGFIDVIKSLHAKYENAEEVAKAIEVRLVGPLASARVPFAFVMGPNTLEGEDIFNLAFCKGEWKIIHKSYYL
jgi:putative lumazine-binding protein